MKKPIQIDGRTGEGGGQLIRIATGLAAVTSQPVEITNIRGNRPRGGGLKSQHVTSIKWLAEVTDAEVEGLAVGSKTLTFIPRLPPSELIQRNFKISADSGAASTLLILQAIFPFCLFAGNEKNEPIVLDISGGSNVSFSLSFEYLDQVLLPTLEERWQVVVERTLKRRAWSLGSQGRGDINIKIRPLPRGQKLQFRPVEEQTNAQSHEVKSVDVSIIVPTTSHTSLQNHIAKDLEELFPNADVQFRVVEDSGNVARWYILLVGVSAKGTRWGRDVLTSMPKKTKSEDVFISKVSKEVCKSLYAEVLLQGRVDEHLQDQLICFQALSNGTSSLPRREDQLGTEEGRMRKEKSQEPFGHGTLHAQTARWVVSELLPSVKFFNKGDIVEGIGFSA